MYIANFLAFILCTICAIFEGVNGDIEWFIIECIFSLGNLYCVIDELKEIKKNKR